MSIPCKVQTIATVALEITTLMQVITTPSWSRASNREGAYFMKNNYFNSCLKITMLLVVCSMAAGAQDSWQKIPTISPGQKEPHLRGVVISGRVINKLKSSDSKMVISGANHAGIYTLGFWIQGLSSLIPERDLWPYMGPDPGREALNPRMLEIVLTVDGIEKRWNFPMAVMSAGNFPKGDWNKKDLFLSTTIKFKADDYSLLTDMSSGFDHVAVTIGRGVFKNPIEIQFDSKGFKDSFREVAEFVAPSSVNRAK